MTESLGFTSLWTLGKIIHNSVSTLEPLSILSFASAVTEKVNLGTAIIMSPLRNPVVLAKVAATIDNPSDGRLILGVAIGGDRLEYDAVGIKLSERVGRFLEGLQVMR